MVSVWLLEQFYTHVIIDAWHNLSLHCIWDNVEQKLMLVYKQMPYFTLEIAAWSSFWPDLMISQVALTGKTSHVQVFLWTKTIQLVRAIWPNQWNYKYKCTCNMNFKKFMTNLWFLTVLEDRNFFFGHSMNYACYQYILKLYNVFNWLIGCIFHWKTNKLQTCTS